MANYQVKIGQLNLNTGVWPNENELKAFEEFYQKAYGATKALIKKGIN